MAILAFIPAWLTAATSGTSGTWPSSSTPSGVRAGRARRATWSTACGFACHADVNAAKNIAAGHPSHLPIPFTRGQAMGYPAREPRTSTACLLSRTWVAGIPCLRAGEDVNFYDQPGCCGRSDRPDDVTLWTVDRFVAELAPVHAALGLDRLHLAEIHRRIAGSQLVIIEDASHLLLRRAASRVQPNHKFIFGPNGPWIVPVR
jgi:hypothetical protein